MQRILGAALPAALVLLAMQSPAQSADYDPPLIIDAEEEFVPVEVGSGWYLRGDINYEFKKRFIDTYAAGTNTLFNNAFIGLVPSGPLSPIAHRIKDSPITGQVGFGYHVNDYLRADVTFGIGSSGKYSAAGNAQAGYVNGPMIDWRNPAITSALNGIPDYGCSGTRTITTDDGAGGVATQVENDWRRDCNVAGDSSSKSYNGLVNGYVDLATVAGFTPYIGAGVGLTYTRTSFRMSGNCSNYNTVEPDPSVPGGTIETDFACDAPGTSTATHDKAEYNLTYALMAGFAYKLTDNVSLDVGYQYRATPGLRQFALTDTGVVSRRGIGSHQATVGLRYDLW
ncbi:MAG: opacity family porin [Mesorhizobium sp.]